jgi:hypothetical protein
MGTIIRTPDLGWLIIQEIGRGRLSRNRGRMEIPPKGMRNSSSLRRSRWQIRRSKRRSLVTTMHNGAISVLIARSQGSASFVRLLIM